MKNYTILIVTLWAIVSFACSRVPASVKKTSSDIQQHGILFRLKDYKQRIAHLEKTGDTKQAKAEAEVIAQKNRQLMQHFRSNFSYCKVNFFFASQGKDLLEGKRVLLNDNMEPDSTLPLPQKKYIMYYGYDDDRNENAKDYEAFRMDHTHMYIHPTWPTWWTGRDLTAQDISKLSKVMGRW